MEKDRLELYNKACLKCSIKTTHLYSTSFSLGVRCLSPVYREAIYSIYGFVRFADEIVDSFHQFNKAALLNSFSNDTFTAIKDGISTNPILQSFQLTVNKYQIDKELVIAFLKSMEMDLNRKTYDNNGLQDYIYGSAEAVGLMCLKVFCEGDQKEYEKLKEPARRLGAAFQKINFLRDIQEDYIGLSRIYFPGVDFNNFSLEQKKSIENDIQHDFQEARKGIIELKDGARFGVYLAYIYYTHLFRKIKKTRPEQLLKKRYRITNISKLVLLVQSYFKLKLGIV